MSGKPRVYQGVRVRSTVKELLQKHREKEANSRRHKTLYWEHKELCKSTTPTGRHLDPPPSLPPPPRAYSDGSCSLQMPMNTFDDIQQQFEDVLLPSNGYDHNSLRVDYSAPLPPLSASSPLPRSHGISSDTDFYEHGMAASSSSESLTFCHPLDPNSYSPQGSFSSSSSSSCYDSPTRMESSCIVGSEQHRYLHWIPRQDCCWADQQGFPTPDFHPYYEPTDYLYAGPEEEGYFRKDFLLSSEMSYKAL